MPYNDFSSRLGQEIGKLLEYAFRDLILKFTNDYNNKTEETSEQINCFNDVKMEASIEGTRDIDWVICNNKYQPLIIIEVKWLKDGRHLYDKGGWILSMQRLMPIYPSIRKCIAVLLGYWTDKVKKDIENSRRIKIFHIFEKKDPKTENGIPDQTNLYVYQLIRNKSNGLVNIDINKRRNSIINPEMTYKNFINFKNNNKKGYCEIIEALKEDMRNKINPFIEDILKQNPKTFSPEIYVNCNTGNYFLVDANIFNKNMLKDIENKSLEIIKNAKNINYSR